jgi:hypothetical protein
MRLVQLSRHNIAFPSPEGRCVNPMGCWPLAVTSALLGY